MEKRNKHFSLASIIAGILAAGIVLSCAGCSSGRSTADNTPLMESTPSASQPVETAKAPAKSIDVPAGPSSVIETAPPSRPVETPSAAPAATAEPDESAPDMAQAAKGRPSLKTIDKDTVVSGDGWTAYDFRTSGATGRGLDDTMRAFEMYYGICAETDGPCVTYYAYSRVDGLKPVETRVVRFSTGSAAQLKTTTEGHTVSLEKQVNDLFYLSVKFSNDTVSNLYLYINDGEVWVVTATTESAESLEDGLFNRRKTLDALIEEWGVTPENSIGVTAKDIAYPTYAGRTDGHRCDTDLWRALAHEIVEDDTVSDTVKLTLLHDWMTANMAYDTYMTYKLKTSRSNYYKNWSGVHNVYTIRAGKCADFVNIFAIMARELGIPCTSIEDPGHTWNIVFVDGRWYEVDLTGDIKRHVCGADTTDITDPEMTICYDDFMRGTNSLKRVESLGKCIYTDTFARTGKR